MKKLIVLFFMFSVSVALPQDAGKDFLKINQKYNACKKLSMKMEYQLFTDYSTETPFQKLYGTVKRNDELMSYIIGPIEMVRTEKFEVVVDNDEQFIAMMEHKSKVFEWDEKTYIGGLDKILKVCESNVFSRDGKIGCYDMKMKVGEWSRVKIYFNASTYLITKIIFYYKDETILNEDGIGKKDTPRLEITYSDINENPKYAVDEFSETKYVTKISGKYSSIGKYKEYALQVDLLGNIK